jgi:hypothetical protein
MKLSIQSRRSYPQQSFCAHHEVPRRDRNAGVWTVTLSVTDECSSRTDKMGRSWDGNLLTALTGPPARNSFAPEWAPSDRERHGVFNSSRTAEISYLSMDGPYPRLVPKRPGPRSLRPQGSSFHVHVSAYMYSGRSSVAAPRTDSRLHSSSALHRLSACV